MTRVRWKAPKVAPPTWGPGIAPKRYPVEAYQVEHPIRVTSRTDIASLLRAHRVALGMTCEQFDQRAGWADRYTTKLENGPERQEQGKTGFHIVPPISDDPAQGDAFAGKIRASFNAELWLQTAGLALVLMPEHTAVTIGAVEYKPHKADAT